MTGCRVAVEKLILKKMRTEAITTELVQDTFGIYVCALKNFFEQLCTIADCLLLTSDPLVVSQGSLFYQEMFIHECSRQEVVEALIQHICRGGGSSATNDIPATASLIVLQFLADEHWQYLVPFAMCFLTLFDQLDKIALQHVKRVMKLLAKIAFAF